MPTAESLTVWLPVWAGGIAVGIAACGASYMFGLAMRGIRFFYQLIH